MYLEGSNYWSVVAKLTILSNEQEDRLEADWSEQVPLPGELRDILLKKYRGQGLTLERVLLDLHSGRLFGTFGVYIVDAAALLFLILAFTGVWMWMSRLK